MRNEDTILHKLQPADKDPLPKQDHQVHLWLWNSEYLQQILERFIVHQYYKDKRAWRSLHIVQNHIKEYRGYFGQSTSNHSSKYVTSTERRFSKIPIKSKTTTTYSLPFIKKSFVKK